jgi:hypothetical protein
MVDHSAKGFAYKVDSEPVQPLALMDRLNRKRGDWPSPAPKVIVLAHEDITLSVLDSVRGVVVAAGYEWPRVFYFGSS